MPSRDSLRADVDRGDTSVIENVECIHSDDRHDIAPDITEWNDRYYVAFSSGSHHLIEDHVGIVLRSSDLKQWEKVLETAYQARDIKLVALPDRLLMYHMYYDYPETRESGYVERFTKGEKTEHKTGYVEARVTVTGDGKRWSEPRRVYEPYHNLWRPKIHDGEIYAASDWFNAEGIEVRDAGWYHGGGPAERRLVDLLCSPDGVEWNKVSTIVQGGGHTETEILFVSNSELWAISRSDGFYRAKPPYKEWRYTQLIDRIAGPAMIKVSGTIYAAGRYHGFGKGVNATAIWRYDPRIDNFTRMVVLPEPGHYDLSYPGFLAAGDAVYMVYYSSHQHGDAYQSPHPEKCHAYRADIFLAKLKL